MVAYWFDSGSEIVRVWKLVVMVGVWGCSGDSELILSSTSCC